MDIREDKHFYKIKLKHYKETSMFIIDRKGTQSEINFMQWNIFLLRTVLMNTVFMICLLLNYLLTYIFEYHI